MQQHQQSRHTADMKPERKLWETPKLSVIPAEEAKNNDSGNFDGQFVS